MDNCADYKEFWSEIRSQIIRMRTIATLWSKNEIRRLEFEIPIEPTVPEKLINQFEVRNKIELPLSYKSYLLYFGAAGASDYNGREREGVAYVFHPEGQVAFLFDSKAQVKSIRILTHFFREPFKNQ